MVAAVENDRRVHEFLDEGKVGIAELGPLRRENEGVGVADRFEWIGEGNRFRSEIGPGEIFKPLGVANGDNCAFGDEIAYYLNGNGGTDIVCIGLKGQAPDVIFFSLRTQSLSLIFFRNRARWFWLMRSTSLRRVNGTPSASLVAIKAATSFGKQEPP
jgi:hypothetical protein